MPHVFECCCFYYGLLLLAALCVISFVFWSLYLANTALSVVLIQCDFLLLCKTRPQEDALWKLMGIQLGLKNNWWGAEFSLQSFSHSWLCPIMTAETAVSSDMRLGVVRHCPQLTICSAGVTLHTHTPTRSNLARIVGAGGDEVGRGWWEGRQDISSEIPYTPSGHLACKTHTV